jgi:hypothetical protein
MDEALGFPVAAGLPVPAEFPAAEALAAEAPADGAAADGTGTDCEPAARVLEAAGWNLTASSAAIPATVPPRVKRARRNGGLLLEVERLGVDVAA